MLRFGYSIYCSFKAIFFLSHLLIPIAIGIGSKEKETQNVASLLIYYMFKILLQIQRILIAAIITRIYTF
jgi:hypothetical protein